MNATWPEVERRNTATPDRRGRLRGGRRATDLPHPVTCVRCRSLDVRGLGGTLSGFWCECRQCRHVWTLGPTAWRTDRQ